MPNPIIPDKEQEDLGPTVAAAQGIPSKDLPEQPVESEALPVGMIRVVKPGVGTGIMPITEFLANSKEYQIPAGDILSKADLTPDGKFVKTVRKIDNGIGKMPVQDFLDHRNEYVAESKFDAGHADRVKQDMDDLVGQGKDVWSVEHKEKMDERHKNDDVQDADGNYKLKAPDGSAMLVPQKQVPTLLLAGFEFQDKNFQSLYEAYKEHNKSESGYGSGAVGAQSAFEDLPGGKWAHEKIVENHDYIPEKANYLANQVLAATTEKGSATLGTAASMAWQLALPSGLFGEVNLAKAAKAGIMAKLAPEGSSLLRQLAVRAGATGVEGLVISSPQVIAQAALNENPTAAAETAGLGFGLGLGLGTLGGLGKIAKVGFNAALEKGAEFGQAKIVDSMLAKTGMEAEALSKIPAETKQTFIDTLLDKGLTSNSKTDQVVKTFQEVAQGEKLTSTFQKLDKIAEPLAAADVAAKISDVSSKLVKADEKLAPIFESLNERLLKTADKEGNISLENLQKYVKDIGEEINWKKLNKSEDIAKASVWRTGIDELMQAGDKAIAKEPDAKLVESWTTNKSVSEMSQQILDGMLKEPQEALNPLAKLLVKPLTSKLTGIAGGALAGGPVGALFGEKLNEKLIKPVLEKGENWLVDHYANSDTKIGNWLVKNKTSNAIGSYVALDAVKVFAQKTNEIPAFIKALPNVAEKVPAMYIGSKDPIKTILGPDANGLSKSQQFQRLSDKAAELASNQSRQQILAEQIKPFFKDHPELGDQVMKDYVLKAQVINDILNKDNKKEPQAFAKNKPYQPTPAQMVEIEKQLKVVQNPYAILDGMKNGTVTAKQVQVVQQLNPAILQKMREEIAKEAYSGKTTLSHQQRVSASIVMGSPMDASLKNGKALQATFQGNSQAPQEGSGKKPKSQGNSKSLHADKIAGYSMAQRITKQ